MNVEWMHYPSSSNIHIKVVTKYLPRTLNNPSSAHLNLYFPSALKLNISHPALPTSIVKTGPFLCVIAHKSTCNVSSHKWPPVQGNENLHCERHDLLQFPIRFSGGKLITFYSIAIKCKKRRFLLCKCSFKRLSNCFLS